MKKIMIFLIFLLLPGIVNAEISLGQKYPIDNKNYLNDNVRIQLDNWLNFISSSTENKFYAYYLSTYDHVQGKLIPVCLMKEKNLSNFNYQPKFSCDSYYLVTIKNDKINWKSYVTESNDSITMSIAASSNGLIGEPYDKYYSNIWEYQAPYQFEINPNINIGDVNVTPGEGGSVDLSELKPYFMLVAFASVLIFLAVMWRRRSYL